MKKEKHFLHIAKLIAREMNGGITKEEYLELEAWLDESTENRDIHEIIKSGDWYVSNMKNIENVNVLEGWVKVESRMRPVTKVRKLIPHWLKYAAVILALVGLGHLYWEGYFSDHGKEAIREEYITLELENGTVELIDETGTRKIMDAKGNIVGVQNGTNLSYVNTKDGGDLVYNTLRVPYGKRIEIELGDGTLVNLNSGSSLRYPVGFESGESRQVFLSGEAYFNVVKDGDSPFIVNTDDINIKVLGTQFNVASYPEDDQVNTVLVEGSVSIYGQGTDYGPENGTLLEPGFKASWNKSDGLVEVEKADIDMHTAWIGGRIVFRHIRFGDITKKLERQYNVHIINNNRTLDKTPISASFDNETMEEVLDAINEIYPMQYTIEGRKIIINP